MNKLHLITVFLVILKLTAHPEIPWIIAIMASLPSLTFYVVVSFFTAVFVGKLFWAIFRVKIEDIRSKS